MHMDEEDNSLSPLGSEPEPLRRICQLQAVEPAPSSGISSTSSGTLQRLQGRSATGFERRVKLSQTTHGTGILADQLGWCQRGLSGAAVLWQSQTGRVWVCEAAVCVCLAPSSRPGWGRKDMSLDHEERSRNEVLLFCSCGRNHS
ncbi:unnamed protein product [Durusdinium trenchii]|uniref:Uncharacterized protein n=1 Tax=Durusdinium trenchii TaxID=1381693 RepID=A0ABP0HGR4_9DINO